MHPPVSSYTEDDIRVIATIEDYHKLVRLQALRALKLREILQGEMLFPHGYGRCDKHHQQAEKTWEQHKEQLIPRVESGRCNIQVKQNTQWFNEDSTMFCRYRRAYTNVFSVEHIPTLQDVRQSLYSCFGDVGGKLLKSLVRVHALKSNSVQMSQSPKENQASIDNAASAVGVQDLQVTLLV